MTLSKTEEKQLDALMKEKGDLEFEILEKLETLIKSGWDAPKVQIKLETEIKHRCKITLETDPLFEKQEEVTKN